MTAEVSRRGALAILAAATLTACGPTGSERGEQNVDLSGTNDAVLEASARVTGIEHSDSDVDGLGRALSMDLRLDTAAAPTADELDAIVRAIWEHAPFEPNAIRLVAVVDDAGEATVDLREAAGGLEPLRFRNFGQGGVNLLGMQQRYGEWQKPA